MYVIQEALCMLTLFVKKLFKHVSDIVLRLRIRIRLIQSNSKIIPIGELTSERDRSLIWHCMWTQSRKQYHGLIYDIMRRTRHQYHSVAPKFEKARGDS